ECMKLFVLLHDLLIKKRVIQHFEECLRAENLWEEFTGSLEWPDERGKIVQYKNDSSKGDSAKDGIIHRNGHHKKHYKIDHEILNCIDISRFFLDFKTFFLQVFTSS